MTSTSRRTAFVSVAAALVMSGLAAGGPALAAGRHTAVKGKPSSTLTDVTAVPKSKDVWAVGSRIVGAETSTNVPKLLVLHRHTGAWSTGKLVAPDRTTISAIAAGSATSIWMVGNVTSAKDGKDRWFVATSTGGTFHRVTVPIAQGQAWDVAASSPSDVWVIGGAGPDNGLKAATLHWNGHKWAKTAVPAAAASLPLHSISTSGPKNAWLYAGYGNTDTVLQWNGVKWVVSSYSAPTGAVPKAIATSSSKDVFLVGSMVTQAGTFYVVQNYAAHWDGASWTTVTTPTDEGSKLASVTATKGTAWAVGSQQGGGSTTVTPVILHYAGGAFVKQTSYHHTNYTDLVAVSSTSPTNVVVAGNYFTGAINSSPSVGLIELFNGSSWAKSLTTK
jgi:hypothetical protein